jgi:hypothetical protein
MDAHINGWTLYDVTIRVGRRVYRWQRYAPDTLSLLTSLRAACVEEFHGRKFDILDWKEAR